MSQEESTNQNSLNTLRQLCPYNDFCQRPAIKSIDDKKRSPCCRSCSCDIDCEKFQSCCPDKEGQDLIGTEETAEWPCKGVTIGWTRTTRTIRDIGLKEKTYFVTDHCPADVTDEQLKRKCNSTDTTQYEGFLWVSDSTTGQIFQNQFCASCHGVQQFVYWRTGIKDCTDPLNDSLPIEFIFQNNKCYLMLEEPTEMHSLSAKYRCFIPDISQCNKTGRWEHFNETINTACNSFYMPLITETPGGTVKTVYENIFCYLCNKPRFQPEGLCSSGFVRTASVSFIGMLDFNWVQVKTDVNRCGFDEIYDPVLVN